MPLVTAWAKPTTTTLSVTASTFVLGTGTDNFVLTTGTQGDYPYYSRDGGDTWTAATVNDPDWTTVPSTCQITVSPADGKIYLVNQQLTKLYVSTDDGVTYSIASTGIAFTCLTCVGATLFGNLSTGTTLYKSTDYGVTFTTVTTPDSTADKLSCSSNGSALFLCAGNSSTYMFSVYRSLDSGASWTQVITDHSIGYVGAIFHTQTDMYLGIYDTSAGILLLRSSDNFTTNTALPTSLLPAPTTAGGSDSSNDIYFGSQFITGVLCTSNDAGVTVENEAPDAGSAIVTLATSDSSIVAITTGASGISAYRSALPGGKVVSHAPVISPAVAVNASPLVVTITGATAGASIYYTVDGSTPSAASTLYTAPFTLAYATATIVTVKAIAVLNTESSSVASYEYHIGNQVAAPVIANAVTDFTYTTVTITDSTTGAAIYYTVDGSTPTTASSLYTAPFINLESSVTVKAIAILSGYFDSDIAAQTFTTSLDASDYPTLGPYIYGNGYNSVESETRNFTVGTSVHVEMRSSTSYLLDHAPIYYTLDGSTPTAASTKYTGPLDITSSCVIKVVAIKGTAHPIVGKITTITYVFTAGTVSKPAAYTIDSCVTLPAGIVTIGSNPASQVSMPRLVPVFIPDYNNGTGAVAVSVYSGGNTPGYIYICDPLTFQPIRRLPAVDPTASSSGSYAMAYSTDTGLLYVASDTGYLYSIDVATDTVTKLNGTLPSTIYKYLVYNNVDRCLYGCCSAYNAAAFIKYNTVTNVLSTILSNLTYFVDFCDPETGTLYGRSSSSTDTGLFTIDTLTGAATKVFTTTTSYDRVLYDAPSKSIYAVQYGPLTVYAVELAAGTETLKFTIPSLNGGNEICIASVAAIPAPVFSLASGTYNVAQQVAITCANPSASIYYTVDGSTPTTASTLYVGSFVITASCSVKAIAVSVSNKTSAVAIASFTVLSGSATVNANVLVCDLTTAAVYGVKAQVSVQVTAEDQAAGYTGKVDSDSVTGAFSLPVPSTPTFSPEAPTTPIYRKFIVTCEYDNDIVVGSHTQTIAIEVQPNATVVIPDFVFQVGAVQEPTSTTATATAVAAIPYTGSLGMYPLFGAEATDYYNLIYGNTTLPGLPKGLFWDVRAVPVPFKPLDETSFVVVVDSTGVNTTFRMRIYREAEPADTCSDVIDFIPDNEDYVLNIRLGRGLNLFDIYTQVEDGTWRRVYSYSVTATLYASLLHGYATVICSYATQPLLAFQQELASPASTLLASPLIAFDKLLPGKTNLFRMARQLVVDAQMQGAGQTAGITGLGSALFQQTPLLLQPLADAGLDINATWLRPLQTAGGTRNNVEYHVWSISNTQARQAALLAWYTGNHAGNFTILESNDELVRVQDTSSGEPVITTVYFHSTDSTGAVAIEQDDTETAETAARTYWELLVTSVMLFDGLGVGSGDYINWYREPAYVAFPGLYDNGADPYFDEGINFDSDAKIGWDREDTSNDPDKSGFIGVPVTGESNSTRVPGIGVGILDRTVDEVTAVCALSADFSLATSVTSIPAPIATPTPGSWATPLTVSMALPGNYITTLPVVIMYTLDGSEPTASTGTVYSGPITLTAGCTVKLCAVAVDAASGTQYVSAVASSTYTLTYPNPTSSGFLEFDQPTAGFTWVDL